MPLLVLDGCQGQLTSRSGDSPEGMELFFTFDLRVEANGQCLITFNSSDPATVRPLSYFYALHKILVIIATHPDGTSINVTQATISRLSIGTDNVERCHKIAAQITVDKMSIRLPELFSPSEEVGRQAQYLVKGLVRTLGFSARVAPWKISGNSETETDSPDTVSARIFLELDDDEAGSHDFRTQCDEIIQRILEVLGVAVGTSLDWSMCEILIADQPPEHFFQSTQATSPPFLPLFHSLNLSPILALALERHTPEFRKATGLNVAIYWYLNYTSRAEAYYLHLMTALEHLVSCHSEGKSKARFSKTIFAKQIRPALRAAAFALKEEGTISEEDLAFIEAKLGGLNMKTLRDGLIAMLTDWNVQYDDLLAKASLDDLIEVRNKLTHQGAVTRDDDEQQFDHFWQCHDVLIELLKRVFLSAWAYRGSYISHFGGGYHDAVYPPNTPIESP